MSFQNADIEAIGLKAAKGNLILTSLNPHNLRSGGYLDQQIETVSVCIV
jgi:hypothetical protein